MQLKISPRKLNIDGKWRDVWMCIGKRKGDRVKQESILFFQALYLFRFPLLCSVDTYLHFWRVTVFLMLSFLIIFQSFFLSLEEKSKFRLIFWKYIQMLFIMCGWKRNVKVKLLQNNLVFFFGICLLVYFSLFYCRRHISV